MFVEVLCITFHKHVKVNCTEFHVSLLNWNSIHKLNKLACTATLLAQVSSSLYCAVQFAINPETFKWQRRAGRVRWHEQKKTIRNLLLRKRIKSVAQCFELVSLLWRWVQVKNCCVSSVGFTMEKVGRAKDFEKVSKKGLVKLRS